MTYCEKCGTPVAEDLRYCPQCGSPIHSSAQQSQTSGRQNDPHEEVTGMNDVVDTTPQRLAADAQTNKTMAILAYLSILVLIPLFAAKDSPFARYHTNQGLILFLAEIAYSVLYSVLSGVILAISWRLYFLVSIIGFVGLVFLVLSVIGIINAANGAQKELPVIGKMRLLK